jgi:hypothetical protein
MNKDSRAKNKAKGLCCHCPKEVVPGQTRCQVHLDYQRLLGVIRRDRYKLDNKCPRCAKTLQPDMDIGKICCLNCREVLYKF